MGLQILSPLSGAYKITTNFWGKVILGPLTGQQHNALDYATPIGTPIYAVTDGVIKRADGTDEWGGNRITLANSANGLTADYAHLKDMYVRAGDSVKAGQVIGTTGNSGKATTGPHLLFGLKLHGTPIDPEKYINGLVDPANFGASQTELLKWLKSVSAGYNGTWGDWEYEQEALTKSGQSANLPTGYTFGDINGAIDRLGLGKKKVSATDATKIVADALAHGAGHSPIPGVDAAVAVADFLGKAANPSNWAKFLAIAGGAGMILWGGVMLYNAS